MARRITWDEKKRLYDIARYHRRKAAGLCPRCPNKPEEGFVYCRKCLDRDIGRKR